MKEWTQEAKDYLEGYLGQVAALARSRDEDSDIIVDELRGHITNETEEIAGGLVTLDHLRRVLAAVGSPEQVLGQEAATPIAAKTRTASPPPQRAPQTVVVQQKDTRSGCLVKSLIAAILVVVLGIISLPIIGIISTIAIPSLMRSRSNANEAAVIGTMKSVVEMQNKFQQACHIDTDGNGVGDFGTFEEIHAQDHGVVSEQLSTGHHCGYRFELSITHGNGETQPGFELVANPIISKETGVRSFYTDETGVVRFEGDAWATKESPPLV